MSYVPNACTNSVTVPPQHIGNFSRPLEIMQYQEHEPFAGTKCFLKAEPLLKVSSAADDQQQNGQVTTQHRKELVQFDRRLTVKMIAEEVNLNRKTVRLILTEELGMRSTCVKMLPRNLT